MGEQGPGKARRDHKKEAVEKNLQGALCTSIRIIFFEEKKDIDNKIILKFYDETTCL